MRLYREEVEKVTVKVTSAENNIKAERRRVPCIQKLDRVEHADF